VPLLFSRNSRIAAIMISAHFSYNKPYPIAGIEIELNTILFASFNEFWIDFFKIISYSLRSWFCDGPTVWIIYLAFNSPAEVIKAFPSFNSPYFAMYLSHYYYIDFPASSTKILLRYN